jgi:D-glycero-D-manno-heptose 1,7-bisphosphate phosphatase
MTRKAAFLDRDGVINVDRAYVHRWEDFEFLPGAVEAMRRLQDAGYALVVVTNQSGVARGYYGEDDVARLHEAMAAALAQAGVRLAAVEHCPHHPGGRVARYAVACDCRKPAPGMILRAARALELDLAASVMFGDKASDIEAARRAGVGRAVRVAPNAGAGAPDGDEEAAAPPDHASLLAAVEALAV